MPLKVNCWRAGWGWAGGSRLSRPRQDVWFRGPWLTYTQVSVTWYRPAGLATVEGFSSHDRILSQDRRQVLRQDWRPGQCSEGAHVEVTELPVFQKCPRLGPNTVGLHFQWWGFMVYGKMGPQQRFGIAIYRNDKWDKLLNINRSQLFFSSICYLRWAQNHGLFIVSAADGVENLETILTSHLNGRTSAPWKPKIPEVNT